LKKRETQGAEKGLTLTFKVIGGHGYNPENSGCALQEKTRFNEQRYGYMACTVTDSVKKTTTGRELGGRVMQKGTERLASQKGKQ